MTRRFAAIAVALAAVTAAPAFAQAPNPPAEAAAVADLQGFTHHYAEVNGRRIHYVSGGAGRTILFVHGWPYSWYEWKDVLPLISAAGYRAIAINMPGYGDSDWPETGYEKRAIAEDIHQLMSQLGVETFDLVGTDIGTMVSYAYAAAYPESLGRLVVSESVLPGFGLERSMDPDVQGYWHFGFQRQRDFASTLIEGQEYWYLNTLAWTNGAGNAGVTDADKTVYMRSLGAPGGIRASFGVYSTLFDDGAYNREQFRLKGKLKVPVLVLNGDRGIPQPLLLDGVREVAETVTAGIIPESGHAISENQPQAVADAVLAFLREGEGQP